MPNYDKNLFNDTSASANYSAESGNQSDLFNDTSASTNYTIGSGNQSFASDNNQSKGPQYPDPRKQFTNSELQQKKQAFLNRMNMSETELNVINDQIQQQHPDQFVNYASDYGGQTNGQRIIPIYTAEGDKAVAQPMAQSKNPNQGISDTNHNEDMLAPMIDQQQIIAVNEIKARNGIEPYETEAIQALNQQRNENGLPPLGNYHKNGIGIQTYLDQHPNNNQNDIERQNQAYEEQRQRNWENQQGPFAKQKDTSRATQEPYSSELVTNSPDYGSERVSTSNTSQTASQAYSKSNPYPDPRKGLSTQQKAIKKQAFLQRMGMDETEFNAINQDIQKQNPDNFLDYTSDYGGQKVDGSRVYPVYTPEGIKAQATQVQSNSNPYQTTPSPELKTKREQFMKRMHMDELDMEVTNDGLQDGTMVDYLSEDGGILPNGNRELPVFDGQNHYMVMEVANQGQNHNRNQGPEHGPGHSRPIASPTPTGPTPQTSTQTVDQTFRDNVSSDEIHQRLKITQAKIGKTEDLSSFNHQEQTEIKQFQQRYQNASDNEKLDAAMNDMRDILQPQYLAQYNEKAQAVDNQQTTPKMDMDKVKNYGAEQVSASKGADEINDEKVVLSPQSHPRSNETNQSNTQSMPQGNTQSMQPGNTQSMQQGNAQSNHGLANSLKDLNQQLSNHKNNNIFGDGLKDLQSSNLMTR